MAAAPGPLGNHVLSRDYTELYCEIVCLILLLALTFVSSVYLSYRFGGGVKYYGKQSKCMK